MIKELLKDRIYKSVSPLFEDIDFDLTSIDLDLTKNPIHGDFATNLALKFAKKINLKPMDLGNKISILLKDKNSDIFSSVECINPGFINLKLKLSVFHDCLSNIFSQRQHYGSGSKKNEKVLVEFVSANPTGLLHLGHLRNAAVGDSLARILEFDGYEIEKEYYINDYGNQIRILGESLNIRIANILGDELEMPKDGYHGEYLKEIAQNFIDDKLDTKHSKNVEFLSSYAKEKLLNEIKNDLHLIDITFNNWFSETSEVHDTKLLDNTLKNLRDLNVTYSKDDAEWIKTSEYGDNDDWVIIKQDKSTTYFLNDIAYHRNKFSRGYSRIINVWGADHHSHVSRLNAAMKSLGFDNNKLQFVMIQFVRLLRDGQDISMSKRSGEYTTIRDLLAEVNKDVVRFIMVMRSSDSHFDFDLGKCLEDSDDNPVFYIQYANARISSIIQKTNISDYDLSKTKYLINEKEILLIKKIISFKEIVEESSKTMSPHKISFYLQDLARDFHSYYKSVKILDENPSILEARLILILVVKEILINGLKLLGASSPENM